MRLKHRLILSLTGIAFSVYGSGMLQSNHFSYHNSYGMTLYSPGVIALGVFFFFLALLPPASWVEHLLKINKAQRDHKRRTDRA